MTATGARLPTPRERRYGIASAGIGFTLLAAGIIMATLCSSGPITCNASTSVCGPSLICPDAGYGVVLVTGGLVLFVVAVILVFGRAAHGEGPHPEEEEKAGREVPKPARSKPEPDPEAPRWKLK